MSTLEPHQQRVVDERADLDAKIKKLADFIRFSPIFKELPGDEQGRLYRQHTAMRAYSGVLGERIEAFTQ
jgi:hypothetical protein